MSDEVNLRRLLTQALSKVHSKEDLGVILQLTNRLLDSIPKAEAKQTRREVARALRRPIVPFVLSTPIHVDRSITYFYPDYRFEHPELAHCGPTDYDFADLPKYLWLHAKQEGGRYVPAQAIYEHLLTNDMLRSCLGYADLRVIRKINIDVYRAVIGPRDLFFWKGIVRRIYDGQLYVPYLEYKTDRLKEMHYCVSYGDLGNNSPAARFPS